MSGGSALTQARLQELLHYDPDTGIFTRKTSPAHRVKIGDVLRAVDGSGYIQANIDGKAYKAHRLAWLYVYGKWPKGEIDHINRNRTDNRIANLRDVSKSENQLNTVRRSCSTSGMKNVYRRRDNGGWRVSKQVHGVVREYGTFTCLGKAAKVAIQVNAGELI